MTENDGSRTFSTWARWTLGCASLLFAILTTLWASTQDEIWKYSLPLALCLIAGANLLPTKAARYCAKPIALAIVLLGVYALITSFRKTTLSTVQAIWVCVIFGLPSLLYLAAGQRPFSFGATRSNKSLERGRDG